MQPEVAGLDALHPPGRCQLFAPADARGRQQAPGDIEWRRPFRQRQAESGVVDDLQRMPFQQLLGIGADRRIRASVSR